MVVIFTTDLGGFTFQLGAPGQVARHHRGRRIRFAMPPIFPTAISMRGAGWAERVVNGGGSVSIQRMKGFLLVLAIGLLNPAHGYAGSLYPPEINRLLPPNSHFEDAITEQINKTHQGKLPKNRRTYSGTPPNSYVFTSDQGFDRLKALLSQKGVVWKNVPLEKLTSQKIRKNPEVNHKMFFGRYGSWRVALATYLYNRQTRQRVEKATIHFTKIE